MVLLFHRVFNCVELRIWTYICITFFNHPLHQSDNFLNLFLFLWPPAGISSPVDIFSLAGFFGHIGLVLKITFHLKITIIGLIGLLLVLFIISELGELNSMIPLFT